MDEPLGTKSFEYLDIFETLPLPATLIDTKGTIVDINQASLEVALRYGPPIGKEDRIGHHIAQFVSVPEERTRFEAFIDELLHTGENRHFRWKSINLAGRGDSYWNFHARTFVDPAGRIAGALILREDITEQIRQEQRKEVFSRVRNEIWKMKSSEDMEQVLSTVRGGLLELRVPLMYCSVNLIDESSNPATIMAYSMDPEEHWRRQPITSPGTEVLLQLWQNEEPTYRTDLEQVDIYDERAHLRVPVRALIDVPFSQGTLSISSTEPRAFSQDDVDTLCEMARISSEGFQRMADFLTVEQRNRELEEKERLLSAYHQIGQTTLSSLDLEQILDSLATSLIEAGIFESIMIALVDEEKQQIEVVRNIIWKREDGVRTIAISGGPVGVRYDLSDDNITPRTARTGEMAVIEEYDERFDSRFTDKESRQGKVAYFIPIKREDRVLAVLATGSMRAEKEALLHRVEVMQPLLEQAAIALSHAQLYADVQRETAERQHAEEELRRTQNLQSLGLLAGGIAHDFNNMLTGITGNLSLVERMLNADGEEIELVQEAQKAAKKTKNLTQQLMTFARGGAPVKETASVKELITDTTSLSLRGSKTRPASRFPNDLWAVDIDRGQVGQVIQNLVLNADQAMPQGGILEIAAENVEFAAGNPLHLDAGIYVRISFADQGIGIPQEVLPNIFDPYFTTKSAGHGLGLSISHSIITRHGGHISVQSEQGVGTTLSIVLPASEEQKTTKEKSVEKPSAPMGGRILLMDDDKTIHQVVGRMLKSLGYDVGVALHGDEALQAYRTAQEMEEPYDVVIMDLTIPGGMGGEEAVQKLHAIDPRARVIVSSGYSNDPVMANYADYGFCGMIRKPVDLDDLLETVQNALATG
jgi:PAS domain S-box-containing protein